MKIGVFDSGKGGEFVADGLRKALVNDAFIVVNDQANVPYGNKSAQKIRQLTEQAIQPLLKTCPIIVIACNTATVSAIDYLRAKYPKTKFVGLEPMIKPAAKLTRNQHISLLATKATNNSAKTKELITTWANDITVDNPDTDNWAELIEHDKLDQLDYNPIKQSVDNGSDVLILGCTHYIILKQKLEQLFPNTTVIEPTKAIVDRIEQLKVSL